MNRLVRMPSAFRSATSGATRVAIPLQIEAVVGGELVVAVGHQGAWAGQSPDQFHEPRVVADAGAVAAPGPAMGLPSMLNSTASMAASSKQSCARIWRWSGRGCTVMPSAPAAMHMRACSVTLGWWCRASCGSGQFC